jgi:CHASE3 domain sensor protein
VPQDPAQIQRQIEDTRAELAHTIDAIADIVSPKRAAKRGVDQVRARVEELRAQISGPQQNGQPQRQLPPGMSAELQGSTLYGTKRTVRWDRVVLVGGGAVLLLVVVRRRRNR